MVKSLKESGLLTSVDAFGERLSEMNDLFSQKYHVSVIGRDFESVLTNETLFESYVTELTGGFPEAFSEGLESMLENTRTEILRESTLTGIQAYSSLSMPILVKLWARLAMTNALPTEPTKTPAFTVPFIKPYIADADGNKFYLPESINNTPETLINLRQLTAAVTMPTAGVPAVTTGKVSEYDLFTGLTVKAYDTVDKKFAITKVKFTDSHNAATYELKGQRIVLGTNGELYGEIEYPTGAATTATDVLMGRVNLGEGKMSLVSMSGKLVSIEIQGYLSSEAHTSATQVGFDVDRRDINIGTAQHIEASMPLEFITDVNAMYDIDGAAVVTDNMSAISAQKVDLDIIEFLERAYQGTDATYVRNFDVYPSADYHMHPNEWVTGLRKTIDFLTTTMKNDFKSYDAYWVIVGNPLDTDLLPNVDWTFRQVDDTMNGIDVNYSMGAMKGSNHYKIISSDLIPQGALTIFAVPTRDNYKTFVYYPYTFNVVSNYLNTVNERIPNIMMTRRYELTEFTPIIGRVIIEHNDGTQYSR